MHIFIQKIINLFLLIKECFANVETCFVAVLRDGGSMYSGLIAMSGEGEDGCQRCYERHNVVTTSQCRRSDVTMSHDVVM